MSGLRSEPRGRAGFLDLALLAVLVVAVYGAVELAKVFL